MIAETVTRKLESGLTQTHAGAFQRGHSTEVQLRTPPHECEPDPRSLLGQKPLDLKIAARTRTWEVSTNGNSGGGDNRSRGRAGNKADEVGGAPDGSSVHYVGFGSVKVRKGRICNGGWPRMDSVAVPVCLWSLY